MQLSCFYCGKHLTATAQQLGTEVACPHCGKVVRLPDAEQLGPEEQAPAVHHWLTDSVSLFASLIFHMGLLFLFAAVTCDYRSGTPQGEEVSIGQLPGVDLNDSSGEILDNSQIEQNTDASDMEQLVTEATPPSDLSDSGDTVSLSEVLPGGASGGASAVASGISGGGGSVGAGTTFMGLRASGSRICIVADCSGSMSGSKFEFLKEEILETIRSMPREAEFQIVFFNSRANPYPQSGWRSPRRDFDSLRQWMNSISPSLGTEPLTAFEIAFRFSPPPDDIFFMTDGQFDDGVVPQVARLNVGRRTKIQAISFIDKSAEPQMRKIAQDSGGAYRHVSGF